MTAPTAPTTTSLPRLLVLTDRTQAVRPLAEVLRAAVAGGADAVVVREKDLPRADRAAMAAAIRPLVDTLLVASDPSIPADGTHLAASDTVPEPRPALMGRSCHDAADVDRASAEGCDYLVVSPVFPTDSKPGYGPALGVDGLRALVARTTVPVYALGGLTPARVGACLDAGAHGAAVMGAVMRAEDPAATVAAFVSALTPSEPATAHPPHLAFSSRILAPWRKDSRQEAGVGRAPRRTPAVALTIAGSDSGGGAGIQADLATFAASGVFGTSAVTAVTAQDTVGVHGIHPIPVDVVLAQIEAVLDDLPVAAVKTGLIGSVAVLNAVADLAAAGRLPNLVVDPVLIASSGDPLVAAGTGPRILDRLVPHCRAVTPNRAEAEALLGRRLHDLDDVRAAAACLARHGAPIVVITGGPAAPHEHSRDGRRRRAPAETVDVVAIDGEVHELRTPRVVTGNDHGTGCAHSAALAAGLARGLAPLDAVRAATTYVHTALTRAAAWRLGSGRGPLDHLRPETP